MKILKHFNQKVFTGFLNPLPVQPYFFQSFELVQNKLKADDSLGVKIYTKAVSERDPEDVLIFFNSVNTNISASLKKITNIADNIHFMTNQIDFEDTPHWQLLTKVLDEKKIRPFDKLRVWKEADFSHLKIIEINPALSSVRCPVFNSLLAKGAQLESAALTPKNFKVLEDYELSFQHGLKLIKGLHK